MHIKLLPTQIPEEDGGFSERHVLPRMPSWRLGCLSYPITGFSYVTSINDLPNRLSILGTLSCSPSRHFLPNVVIESATGESLQHIPDNHRPVDFQPEVPIAACTRHCHVVTPHLGATIVSDSTCVRFTFSGMMEEPAPSPEAPAPQSRPGARPGQPDVVGYLEERRGKHGQHR